MDRLAWLPNKQKHELNIYPTFVTSSISLSEHLPLYLDLKVASRKSMLNSSFQTVSRLNHLKQKKPQCRNTKTAEFFPHSNSTVSTTQGKPPYSNRPAMHQLRSWTEERSTPLLEHTSMEIGTFAPRRQKPKNKHYSSMKGQSFTSLAGRCYLTLPHYHIPGAGGVVES